MHPLFKNFIQKCQVAPNKKFFQQFFEELVVEYREAGWTDDFITRQITDDFYRLTGKLYPQDLIEKLVKEVN